MDEEIHNTGKWKTYENRLRGVDLEHASPSEVGNLMYNLLADWNELESVSIKDIADFHYKFEKIHPFQDGNGRIGRFIILKQCLEKNIDLIAIDNEYSEEYKSALYKAQKSGDSEELVHVFEKCQRKLTEKLSEYENLLSQVKEELNIPKK